MHGSDRIGELMENMRKKKKNKNKKEHSNRLPCTAYMLLLSVPGLTLAYLFWGHSLNPFFLLWALSRSFFLHGFPEVPSILSIDPSNPCRHFFLSILPHSPRSLS